MRSVFLNRSLTYSLTLLTLSVFSIKIAISGDALPERLDGSSIGSPPFYKGKDLLPLSPPISPMESLASTPPWPYISPSVLSLQGNHDREGAGDEAVSTKVALKPLFSFGQSSLRPKSVSASGQMITEAFTKGWLKTTKRGRPSLQPILETPLEEATKLMLVRSWLEKAGLFEEGDDAKVATLMEMMGPYLTISDSSVLKEEGEQGDDRADNVNSGLGCGILWMVYGF